MYARRPAFPCSLPRPDCFIPPKGTAGDHTITELTATIPHSSASDTRKARLRSFVKTIAAKPYSESFASSSASSSVLNLNQQYGAFKPVLLYVFSRRCRSLMGIRSKNSYLMGIICGDDIESIQQHSPSEVPLCHLNGCEAGSALFLASRFVKQCTGFAILSQNLYAELLLTIFGLRFIFNDLFACVGLRQTETLKWVYKRT